LLPEDVVVAHKSGSVPNARCDAGIIYSANGPIAICMLTNNNKDRRWREDNAAEMLNARIAKTVFEHFNPPNPAAPNAKTVLKIGDFGRLVESVQRTLNAKMEPSPDLSIDGDFGPATQTAVIAFQSAKKIKAIGMVESTTWKALSPLLTDRVPDPETVNAVELPVVEPDSIDGRPFVGCKAWAIADLATGELVGGSQVERQLDIASTTKVMTAYLVLHKASAKPVLLDEIVTFSRRADRTRGSTSAIEEGELLPVRDLLYGLMLPSGNDASVALAEHFGHRIGDAKEGVEERGAIRWDNSSLR
jgi:D-alanyl-D-alanine carboxypeptidase (penicillin-binding protein 5/6)